MSRLRSDKFPPLSLRYWQSMLQVRVKLGGFSAVLIIVVSEVLDILGEFQNNKKIKPIFLDGPFSLDLRAELTLVLGRWVSIYPSGSALWLYLTTSSVTENPGRRRLIFIYSPNFILFFEYFIGCL